MKPIAELLVDQLLEDIARFRELMRYALPSAAEANASLESLSRAAAIVKCAKPPPPEAPDLELVERLAALTAPELDALLRAVRTRWRSS